MVTQILGSPLPVIFAVSLVLLLGVIETGRWFGIRALGRGGDTIATLEGAVLGLMELLISFTFSMALARFDGRRDAVLQEANAIGTTALRARLLPAPYNTNVLKLLREYTEIRLHMARHAQTLEQAETELSRSGIIQELLWQQVKAVAAKDNAMVPTGVFITSLNELIDDQEKRLTAIRNRVPEIVILSLYGIAITAAGFTGYAAGLETRRSRLPAYLVGILVVSVILLIQDLDRPGQGFVRVSQQPMIDTAASLAGFTE